MKAKKCHAFFVCLSDIFGAIKQITISKQKPMGRWDITGKNKMKNVLAIAVLVGMTSGAMVLSAFTIPTKEESVLEVTASPVWEGVAYANGAYGKYEEMFTHTNNVRIRVYPSDNSCDAYYAVLLSSNNDVHYTVKSNPDYDYRSTEGSKVYYYSHYISVGSSNYYFKM